VRVGLLRVPVIPCIRPIQPLVAPPTTQHHRQEQEQETEEGVDVDEQGVPTGIVKETAVMRVTSHMVETDKAIRKGYFRSALARCLRAGITAVQTNDSKAWRLYQQLAAAGACVRACVRRRLDGWAWEAVDGTWID